MNPSTPLRNKGVQFKVNDGFASSPLRKSIVHNASPVVLVQNRNDDEAERTTRRSMVQMQRRISRIGSTSASSPLVELGHIFGEAQMKDHLEICTKLYAENKISVKNAWELHIIDVIQQMANSGTNNVLQIAGPSLDIGAKVYSFRVDDVHTRGLKLASVMSKTKPREDGEDDDDVSTTVAEDGDGADKHTKKQRKKKKKITSGEKTTIVKDDKSLFADVPQLESVYFSTKEDSEISSTENLLTYRVRHNPSTLNFDLLSTESYLHSTPELALSSTNKYPQLSALIKELKFEICPPVKHFSFGDWDPEKEEQQLQQETFHDNSVVLDENGIPLPELDGSFHDIFADGHNADADVESETEEHHNFQVQIGGGVQRVLDALPEASRQENEYGFNVLLKTPSGKLFDKLWAGPSHWRPKYIRPSLMRYSGANVHAVKSTRKKNTTYELANFDVELVDPSKHQLVNKRPPSTNSYEKVTFPMPTKLYDRNFLWRLKGERNTLLLPPKSTQPQLVECEVEGYNYENPNDSQYCSQHNSSSDMFGGDPPDNDDPGLTVEENVAHQHNFMSEHLVDAPEMAIAFNLQFSLTARKVDMKKLKSAIWKCLTRDETRPDVSKQEALVTKTSVSDLYHNLLPQKLPPNMSKEMSPYYGLTAVLYLCNENSLCLIQKSDLKDFDIIRAQPD